MLSITANDRARFWIKVDTSPGCWTWNAGTFKRGYGKFRLRQSDSTPWSHVGAHRVAWMMVFGQIPSGLQVLHHCDNRRCVNPAHLYLGTHIDNMNDRDRRNRTRNGSTAKTLDYVYGEGETNG